MYSESTAEVDLGRYASEAGGDSHRGQAAQSGVSTASEIRVFPVLVLILQGGVRALFR